MSYEIKRYYEDLPLSDVLLTIGELNELSAKGSDLMIYDPNNPIMPMNSELSTIDKEEAIIPLTNLRRIVNPLNSVNVKIKRRHPNAIIPKYAHIGDAGFDVHANIDEALILGPGQRELISTGISFGIPDGYEIQIRSRSGLAWDHGVSVTNSPGTIDSKFTGEVRVILENRGRASFTINPGDRIAQCVLSEVPRAVFVEVDELDETERGNGGFGSTGVKA